MKGAPNETRTHSCRFASRACWPLHHQRRLINICYGTQPADCNELFLLLLILGEYSSQCEVFPSLTPWQSDWCSTPFYLCCIILSLIYFVPRKPKFMSFFQTLYWSTTISISTNMCLYIIRNKTIIIHVSYYIRTKCI